MVAVAVVRRLEFSGCAAGDRGGVSPFARRQSVDLNCLGLELSATFCFHHCLTSLQSLYRSCIITLRLRGKWYIFLFNSSNSSIALGNKVSVL